MTQREIGFIQGIMYSAVLLKTLKVDERNLIRGSGYPIHILRKYASEDAKILKEVLDKLEEEE